MTQYSSYTRSGTGRPAGEFTAASTLRGFLEHTARRAARIDPRYEHVWREIARLTEGGKGLRPHLVLLTAQAYPARPTRPVINAIGAAFELLHTGLIIHDDVIDQDLVRRHAPTLNAAAAERARERLAAGSRARAGASELGVSARATAEHYGRSVGIVAGDLAITGAYRLVATSCAPESRLLRLFEILDEAVFRSAAGEVLDVDHALPGAHVSRADVLTTSRLKTAAYSFEAPLQAGAVLGGAPAAQIRALGEIGRAMGTAYQLVDDLLGVFGDPEQTGKSAVSDLREGKRTMLVALAEHGPYGKRLWRVLDEIAASPAAAPAPGSATAPAPAPDSVTAPAPGSELEELEELVAHARDLLVRSGAKAGVERMARQAIAHAHDLMRDAQLPADLAERLGQVADELLTRLR